MPNSLLKNADLPCGTGFQPVKTGVAPASSRYEHGFKAVPHFFNRLLRPRPPEPVEEPSVAADPLPAGGDRAPTGILRWAGTPAPAVTGWKPVPHLINRPPSDLRLPNPPEQRKIGP